MPEREARRLGGRRRSVGRPGGALTVANTQPAAEALTDPVGTALVSIRCGHG